MSYAFETFNAIPAVWLNIQVNYREYNVFIVIFAFWYLVETIVLFASTRLPIKMLGSCHFYAYLILILRIEQSLLSIL